MDKWDTKYEHKRVELWRGWYWYEGVIFDEHGNRYTQSDIQMSWRVTEEINIKEGATGNIAYLKKSLEDRIAMNTVPKVCLLWEYNNKIVEKVFKLEEV